MPYPVPIVEIAFNDSPYSATPTWTDVTSWVRSLSTDRGRSDDWDDFYGSAQVVLNNRTRLFDPYNTSGAYYGSLLPRRQIRIRAQTNDGGSPVTHDVFRGFIAGWNPQWTDAGTDSTVTLSCFDSLQLLGSEQLPADWSRSYILSTSPRHYYPCDEPVGAFTANQSLRDLGSEPLNMATTAAASSGSQLAVGLVNSSVTGTGSEAALSAQGGTNSSPGSFSVSCWAIPDASAGGNSQFLTGSIYNHFFYFGYDNTTGKYFVEITEPSFGNSKVFSTNISGWDSGMPRMISFDWNSSVRTLALYIDGIAVATTVTNNPGVYIALPEAVNIGTGSVQQVIVWSTGIAQAIFQEIFKYSTVALPESTTARAQRIIGETSFPLALCSFPASPAVSVLEITDNAPFAAPELRRVAASECAPLFVSKSGVLTMYQQSQQFSQTRSIVSQVTYGTGGSKMGQIFELMPDGDSVRNEVNVTMSQGGVYTQRNTASITDLGVSSQTVDTQVQTLADAQEVANITVGWGGNVYPRLSPIDVVLDSTANWSPTMALELMDRITINAQPPSGGNAITFPMLVQNIKCEASPGFWKTTLEGSARWAAVFILGQSLLGGTDLLG
jgi:hypothetical protein